MENVLQLLGQFAFPIVMCVALFWKIDKDDENRRKDDEQMRAELEKITNAHKAETDVLAEALNNNTAVMIRLEELIRSNQKGA